MFFVSKKGTLAIAQPEFKKIEAEMKGGLAIISQRVRLIETPLIMDYEFDGKLLKASNTLIILRGDAGAQPWARQIFDLKDAAPFVLCPESQVLGYRVI